MRVLRSTLVLAFLVGCSGPSKPPTTTDPVVPATPVDAAPVEEPPPVDAPATTAAEPPAAPSKVLVLVDAKGIGLGGNDPVAYRTKQAATKGAAATTSTHGGATYQFADAASKQAFDADPGKHAPQYGGYCAYAASQNRLSTVDPKIFLIYEDQLLVFTNKDFLARFQKDPAGAKAKADANWPGLVEKHGKAP